VNVCANEEMNAIRSFKNMSNSISYSRPKWDLWRQKKVNLFSIVVFVILVKSRFLSE
jgi:hypothetical protein